MHAFVSVFSNVLQNASGDKISPDDTTKHPYQNGHRTSLEDGGHSDNDLESAHG